MISSNKVLALIQESARYFKGFQQNYLNLVKQVAQTYSKNYSKIGLGPDIIKHIQLKTQTQKRLFQQTININNNLLEFFKNPLSPQAKLKSINQNYSKAQQLYKEDKYKQARYYIDKNEDLVEDEGLQKQQLKHCILKGQILHALKEPQLSNYYLLKPNILELNDPEIIYSIGLNCLSLGDKQKKSRGKKSKKSKTKLKPNQTSYKSSKQLNKQQILRSIQFFNKVIELKPDEKNVYDDLADAYKLLRYSKSYADIKHKQISKQSDPNISYKAYIDLARYLNSIDEKDQSILNYSRAIQLNIDNEFKLTFISEVVEIIESEQNNHIQIIPYLEKSIKIIKQKTDCEQIIYYHNFIKLAKCYCKANRISEQLDIYQYLYRVRESQGSTQPLDIYKDIGICYYRLNKYQNAEKYFLLYLSKNKFKSAIYFFLERIYTIQQDPFAAKDILLKLKGIQNNRQVIEKLIVLEKQVGTEVGLQNLQQQLRVFDESSR